MVADALGDHPARSRLTARWMKQWTNVHGISEMAAETNKPIPALSRALYKNAEGRIVVETNLLANQGHAVAVDPESSAISGGCGTATQFYAPAGICAALEIARFWGITPWPRASERRHRPKAARGAALG